MAPNAGGGLLRVNSNAVLVVPPFECAWLQGTEIIDSGCCIIFEVKGELQHPAWWWNLQCGTTLGRDRSRYA